MCIICVKPSNTPIPSETILKTMWEHNKDGAGFMYAADGKVYIQKGFMRFDCFCGALRAVPEQFPIIMHFRIATHGGIVPGLCHPFPLSDSVERLTAANCSADIGIAHNGIIPIEPRKGLSDTAEYIASQLLPLSQALPNWYKNPHALRMVENATRSRMAFLSGSGEIVTIGQGWTEDNGVLYSNGSFIPWIVDEYAEEEIMPLDPEEHYITDVDGEMYDSWDVGINKAGAVFFFDEELCAWCKWSGARALCIGGGEVTYREDRALLCETF